VGSRINRVPKLGFGFVSVEDNMITQEETKKIAAEFGSEFGKGANDTGCTAVQVAILTTRINNLKPHFEANKHDYHSNRGLMKMIGQRKALLKYVQSKDQDKYQRLIGKLGLRK
jgi:small subunit ribosomal protein S15